MRKLSLAQTMAAEKKMAGSHRGYAEGEAVVPRSASTNASL